MLDPGLMVAFARVADAGSFSQAARDLGVTKSAVSKQIARLEDDLGVRLLQRTTRRIALTEAGAAFYQRCLRVASEVEEAELAVTRLAQKPRGLLRAAVPVALGQDYVAPAVPALLEQHPELKIDLALEDRYVDLVAERYDVAIRVGRLGDSSLKARKLGTTRAVVCGAPSYFQRRGTPKSPRDLVRHNCLLYTLVSRGSEWRFGEGKRARRVPVSGNLQSNSGAALMRALVEGAGVAIMPTFYVAEELRRGALRVVLERHQAELDIHAVWPETPHVSPKVRAFVDHFVTRFRRTPWEV